MSRVERSFPGPTAVAAFAPASVANVSAGYDVLGFAVDGIGDRVTLHRRDGSEMSIRSVTGVVSELPLDTGANTASVALAAMAEDHPLPSGLAIELDKGIPLGSGMGGSAASAVAAVVAANQFLPSPLAPEELLPYAIAGESAASGASHGDNVAPSLLGGLTAMTGLSPARAVQLPVPRRLRYVLVHPHLTVETRRARAALAPELPLERHVRQTMHMAGFVAACFLGDLELLRGSLVDLVAEPVRAGFIPGFEEAKAAALGHGAIGFGIAGSGPSVYALVDSAEAGLGVEADVRRVFQALGVDSEGWVGPIRTDGAVVTHVDRRA